MYVRWKRRKGSRFDRLNERFKDTWSAVLVENKRINGKPCQRVVKYLGSFQEEFRGEQWIWVQNEFWQKVTPQLDALGITGTQREQIERQLNAIVTYSLPDVVERHWIDVLKRRANQGYSNDSFIFGPQAKSVDI